MKVKENSAEEVAKAIQKMLKNQFLFICPHSFLHSFKGLLITLL